MYVKKLMEAINSGQLNESKAKLICELLNMDYPASTSDMMKICLPKEMINKIDTAYPADYAKRIRDVLPNWNGTRNVFSYNGNKIFGEMLNVAEYFSEYIIMTMQMEKVLNQH